MVDLWVASLLNRSPEVIANARRQRSRLVINPSAPELVVE